VKLWDLTTKKERLSLRPGQVVQGLQFAGDSRTLVLSGKSVKLWDVVANRELTTLGVSDTGFEYVTIAAKGDAVAAGGFDAVRIWVRDESKWREAPPVVGAGYNPPVAISPDGKLLATGYHGLRLFDLPSRKERTACQGHIGPVFAIAFDGDGKHLISGGLDRSVRIWNAATSEQEACIANPGPVFALAMTPDARVMAVMGTDAIRVRDVARPIQFTVLHHAAPVQALAFSPDGRTLASYGMDETKIWNPAESRQISSLATATNSWFCGLAFSPDGRSMATTGAAKGTIDLWDMSGRRLAVLNGDGSSLDYSPDGKSLAAASDHGNVVVWDVASQQRRHTMPVSQAVCSVAFSPDGKIIAAGGQFGVVKLFDAASGEELATLQRYESAVDGALALAFSFDGRKLATGNQSGVVYIWDLATNQLEASMIGHTVAVHSLAFADGGRTLATASEDRTIRLWDVATGQERMALRGHENPVRDLVFAPDGNVLATSSIDGTVRLWHAASDLDARACKREVDPDDAHSPVAYNELGDRLWQYGRTGEAESAYRKALQRLEKLRIAFPDDPAYPQEMVRSLLSLSLLLRVECDHHSDAEPARLRAREAYRKLAPQDQEAMLFAYGERYRKLSTIGNAQQACRINSQMIELMPDDDAGWLTRAADHLANSTDVKLRDPARATALIRQALESYTKAIEASPNESSLRIGRGRAYMTLKQPGHAISDFSKAIELRPDAWEGWSGRALVHFGQKQWDGAISDFSKAIELAPQVHTNWWHRGHAYLALARWDKAAADFGKVVEQWPAGSEGWYWLALASARLNEPDKALADLRQAIAKGFNNAAVLKNEPSLASLRTREDFGKLLEELRRKATPQGKQKVQGLPRLGIEAAGLPGLPAPPVSPILPPGDLGPEKQVADLLHQRAALDQRAAASPKERWERWNLANEYFRLATALRDMNKLIEAEAAARLALEGFSPLAAEDPRVVHYQYDLGSSGNLLADLLLRSGRFEEALPIARETLKSLQAVVLDRPDRPEYRDSIAVAYSQLGSLLRHLGKPEDAARAECDAVAAWQAAEKLRRIPQARGLLARALPFAEKRDWKQAAAEMASGFDIQTQWDAFVCYSIALVRLLDGDVDGYAQLVNQMPNHSVGLVDPMDILRTRTLHPRGVSDAATLIRLAQSAYNRVVNNWSAQNLGMAQYRAGKFEQALAHIEEARKMEDWYIFWPPLAMAHHRLGHAHEAGQWLDKANKYFRHVTESSSEPLKVTKEPFWQDWAYFEVLLREAKTLIEAETRQKQN
jgi:WD40 repeat protein/Flp pilus assembly protein TadD